MINLWHCGFKLLISSAVVFLGANCTAQQYSSADKPNLEITKFSENTKHRFNSIESYEVSYNAKCSLFLNISLSKTSNTMQLTLTRRKAYPLDVKKFPKNNCDDVHQFSDNVILDFVKKTTKFALEKHNRPIKKIKIDIEMLDSVKLDIMSELQIQSTLKPNQEVYYKEKDPYLLKDDMNAALLENDLIKSICDIYAQYNHECTSDDLMANIAFNASNTNIATYSDITSNFYETLSSQSRLLISFKFIS